MVSIVDGKLVSIWDVEVGGEYQVVADALSDYVKQCSIDNVFLFTEGAIGTDRNFEEIVGGTPKTWEHFHIVLPSTMKKKGVEIGPMTSEYRAQHDVLLRGLKEITIDNLELVLDLIGQNSLYRGEEKRRLVEAFLALKREFDRIPSTNTVSQDLFAWTNVVGPNSWVCKFRNDVIGTLLVDLSTGVDLEVAVKSFEDKVSGRNYRRPTALITPRMKEMARKTIEDLGYLPSLERCYAKLEDLSVTNVLFADQTAKQRMRRDVFDDLPTRAGSPRKMDKIEEVTIDKFISEVLPTAQSIEVFVDGAHIHNLVSLVAPYDKTSKGMFKWDNPFSWSYNGDVADSIKERVKAAGGNVSGDLCCRLAWGNYDDLDFHMMEPGSSHIYFGQYRGHNSPCGGQLDVDMNAVGRQSKQPVENIVYADARKMKPGLYKLYVNQFSSRESEGVGFEVEIDLFGTVHRFSYLKAMRTGTNVQVAEILVSADHKIEVKPVLPTTTSRPSKDIWGLKTEEFRPVTAIMLSPNYWQDPGIGNKHFFFMLQGCVNDGTARGFYNEFLNGDLQVHGKTMEMVGARMRTEETKDQLSGLGFSSTQRNELIVKVKGSFERVLKITF